MKKVKSSKLLGIFLSIVMCTTIISIPVVSHAEFVDYGITYTGTINIPGGANYDPSLPTKTDDYFINEFSSGYNYLLPGMYKISLWQDNPTRLLPYELSICDQYNNREYIMIDAENLIDESGNICYYLYLDPSTNYYDFTVYVGYDDPSANIQFNGVSYSYKVEYIDPSLVGYWNFDGNIVDRGSIGGADGTLYNGASYGSGNWGQSLTLDGTNDYVKVNSNYANFNNMNSFTLSAWVNPTQYNSCNPIINKVTPNRDFMFEINSAGKASFHFAINYNNYYFCVSNTTVPLDTWTHLAVTVTPTQINLYQDGVLVGTRALSNVSPQWTGTNMQIGGFISSYFFPGKLDEVKIFNKALSQDEISNEYQSNGF